MTPRHEVVSHDQWIEARRRLLAEEKEFMRSGDRLSQRRREIPWEHVEKDYIFQTGAGPRTFAQLFNGRSQLIVYHFMFGVDWDAGCPHCSFWVDNFNEIIVHLNQRDVTMIAVSQASHDKLAAYKKRMGWDFEWASSIGTTFNHDFQASFTEAELASKAAYYNFTMQDPGHSEREGISVFYKDETGKIFHTYSTYARGIEMINSAYHLLDLVPKGRDEDGRGQFWVKRHNEYAK
jgi:predicted dithiol-disulfide oxidoreductase (DUF899 family)